MMMTMMNDDIVHDSSASRVVALPSKANLDHQKQLHGHAHVNTNTHANAHAHAHVYIYVQGRHPIFVDELKLVEEEMTTLAHAIHVIEDDSDDSHEKAKLLRRKEHLELEQARHMRQRASRQRRVEARKNKELVTLQKQLEQERANLDSVAVGSKQTSSMTKGSSKLSERTPNHQSLIRHEEQPLNHFAIAA